MEIGVHGQLQVAHTQIPIPNVTEGRSDTYEIVIHPLETMAESTALGSRTKAIHATQTNVVSCAYLIPRSNPQHIQSIHILVYVNAIFLEVTDCL